MMAHLSSEQVQAYLQRTLAAAELLDISEHLGGCQSCRDRIASPEEVFSAVQALQRTVRSAAGPLHLSYEQIEAYADGALSPSDRKAVESHARECHSCATDLLNIQSLRRDLEHQRVIPNASRPWGEFWKSLFGWRGGFVLAAAACAVILVITFRTPARQDGGIAGLPQVPAHNPVEPAPAGSVIRDGSRVFAVRAGGRIDGLPTAAEADRAVLEKALADGRVGPAASLSDLNAKGGVLLGTPAEPARGKLLAPLATVVESDRPVFRWEPIAGATYRVSVYDSGYNLVAGSGVVSGTEWQSPKPLRRGIRYSWQVKVRQNGAEDTLPAPPAPEARFRVLSEDEETSLAQARSAAGDSHLVLGMLYARAGLLDQAGQEFRALRDQNPSSAQVASLLASVEALRGEAK